MNQFLLLIFIASTAQNWKSSEAKFIEDNKDTNMIPSSDKTPEQMRKPITAALVSGRNETLMSLSPDPCNSFKYGLSDWEFTSPSFPQNYPNETDCIKEIEAPVGYVIRIQFIDVFHIEERREAGICVYDYLEIRDGKYGYSHFMIKLCGSIPPFPHLQSTGRFLWLRFHSDATIGYPGFRAIVSYEPSTVVNLEVGDCSARFKTAQGLINTTLIPTDVWQKAIDYGLPVDCAWIIEAEKGNRIYVQFESPDLSLEKPNLCDYNFVQIFKSVSEFNGLNETVTQCGSIIQSVKSFDHMLVIRFYSYISSQSGKRSKLFANFTIQRERDPKEPECRKDEFDCKDGACIPKPLACNGFINCDRPVDEEKCGDISQAVTADILVIAFIGCLLIAGMCGGLVMNIYRKLRQDKQELMELRESIKKSSESVLTERQSASTSAKMAIDQLKVESTTPVSFSESTTSKDTVIEKPANGDLKKMNKAVAVVVPPDAIVAYTAPRASYPQLMLKPIKVPKNQIDEQLFTKPTPVQEVQFRRKKSEPIQQSSSRKAPSTQIYPLIPLPSALKGSQSVQELPTGSKVPTASNQLVPTAPEQPECVEVRDCACQTLESVLAHRIRPLMAPLARDEFYMSASTPARRVARMLPRASGADIIAIYPYYAASSASSETGRSLERLDECSE